MRISVKNNAHAFQDNVTEPGKLSILQLVDVFHKKN